LNEDQVTPTNIYIYIDIDMYLYIT
jgi:hypothetical protein